MEDFKKLEEEIRKMEDIKSILKEEQRVEEKISQLASNNKNLYNDEEAKGYHHYLAVIRSKENI